MRILVFHCPGMTHITNFTRMPQQEEAPQPLHVGNWASAASCCCIERRGVQDTKQDQDGKYWQHLWRIVHFFHFKGDALSLCCTWWSRPVSTFYIRAQSTEQGCDKVWRSGDSKKPTLISGTVRLTHPPNTEHNPQQSPPNNTYQTLNPTINSYTACRNNNPYKRQVHSSSF